MKLFLFLLCSLFFTAQLARAEQVIDLTHSFNERTIYWPTAAGFKFTEKHAEITKQGYFYSGNVISAPEHGGTHMDAPYHFSKKGRTIEKIPVRDLVGDAAIIDLRKNVGENAEYLISKKDITKWEEKNGALTANDIVLFNTGWARFWDNKKKYLGSDLFGDTSHLHFPGISGEAAHYLVSKKVKGIGLDTASLDFGQSKDFMSHRIILGANIYGLENVAELDSLPARGSQVTVAPMKIEGGTGAPVRILAIFP